MANILLVEDNAEMRVLLQELLEWGGHHVTCERTGQDGLTSLLNAAHLPDVIISDLIMPGMDGLTFLQRIRQNPRWSHIRFIIMSGDSQAERLQESRAYADGVLPKPFSLNDLQRIIG
ncbi:MAG: response regulator [Chloroflexi bacterium]|nr:response regulator [Chloroflexota bacterium]